MVLMPTHCCHTAMLCGESALRGRLSLSGRGSDPHAAQCRGPSRGIAEAMDELTSQLLEDIENRLKIRAVRIFIFKYMNSLYAPPAAHASALPHSLHVHTTHAHTTCMHAQRASDTQLVAHGQRRDRLHRVHGRCWSKLKSIRSSQRCQASEIICVFVTA
jgi:hypothetical protein